MLGLLWDTAVQLDWRGKKYKMMMETDECTPAIVTHALHHNKRILNGDNEEVDEV